MQCVTMFEYDLVTGHSGLIQFGYVITNWSLLLASVRTVAHIGPRCRRNHVRAPRRLAAPPAAMPGMLSKKRRCPPLPDQRGTSMRFDGGNSGGATIRTIRTAGSVLNFRWPPITDPSLSAG
jgi:hypothetical protein